MDMSLLGKKGLMAWVSLDGIGIALSIVFGFWR
jgi:hypothetical protein